MNFRENEIIFLLGAGASIEAKIPGSIGMIDDIEKFIETKEDWIRFKKLYCYIKSSIYHGEGINGRFGDKVNYNIERLANTLSEIDKKEEHLLYPFVASWDKRLSELAGDEFKNISEFKKMILNQLQTWIVLPDYHDASYYKCLLDFRNDYQHPLRIFTLNYDLCIEETCSQAKIERGFNERSVLDLSRFHTDEGEQGDIDVFLYKLHGSIDWEENSERVRCSRALGRISPDNLGIIFGTTQKLRYKEPYLTALNEFKIYTLMSKLIVVVGYSFADEHINYIIKNAILHEPERKVLVVSYLKFESESEKDRAIKEKTVEIHKYINFIDSNQVIVAPAKGAKNFMENYMNIEYLKTLFPQDSDLL